MKKTKLTLVLALTLSLSITLHSCIGSFNMTKSLYSWNNDLGDRFVNALVFFAFVVVPIYEVSLLLDGIILNSIEFWTGSNPISMKEGEREIQQITKYGVTYEIVAEKNKFIATQIVGSEAGEKVEFVFNPIEQSWTLVTSEFKKKLVQVEENNMVKIFHPDYTTTALLSTKIHQ